MPRGTLNKVDMLARVYKLKDRIYNDDSYSHWNNEQRKAADDAINSVLEIMSEYRL